MLVLKSWASTMVFSSMMNMCSFSETFLWTTSQGCGLSDTIESLMLDLADYQLKTYPFIRLGIATRMINVSKEF